MYLNWNPNLATLNYLEFNMIYISVVIFVKADYKGKMLK